jgi:thymidylate kinase
MFMIAVSGVDGSGKSTLIRHLHAELRCRNEDLAVNVMWLRYDPRAKRSQPGGAVSTLDRRHKGHPLKRLAKAVRLSPAWIRSAEWLYQRQIAHQLGAVRECDVLIADRYVVDFCADLVGAGAMSLTDVADVLSRFPVPDLSVIASAPSNVLLVRKDAEEDPERLIHRRQLYLEIARITGTDVVDTSDLSASSASLADRVEAAVVG